MTIDFVTTSAGKVERCEIGNCTRWKGHPGNHVQNMASFEESMEVETNKKLDDLVKQIRDKKESINHPQHYGGDTTYEVIKVIEAWQLGFCDGNAIKYISRAKKKGTELEDLKKARWYLDRLISRLEKK